MKTILSLTSAAFILFGCGSGDYEPVVEAAPEITAPSNEECGLVAGGSAYAVCGTPFVFPAGPVVARLDPEIIEEVAEDGRVETQEPAPVEVVEAVEVVEPVEPPVPLITVVLQRGSEEGGQVNDNYLSSYHPHSSYGSRSYMEDTGTHYTMLVRFAAVFKSQGGPIPDDAKIARAELSIYKSSAYNVRYSLHRLLQPWEEKGSTWVNRSTGGSWFIKGARAVELDHRQTPDAVGVVGWEPGWLVFDVKDALEGLKVDNFGWSLAPIGGNTYNRKKFHTSEYSDKELRPKLVISYVDEGINEAEEVKEGGESGDEEEENENEQNDNEEATAK